MSTIIDQIQEEITKFESKTVRKNTGTILQLADGVAKLDGLSEVMYNEMVEFSGDVFGIALNLEEDEVGVVILGDPSKLKEGDEARTTGRLLSVPVGKELLGRVVDALGRPVDGKGPINATEFYPVEKKSLPASYPARRSANQSRRASCPSIR